MRVELPNGKVIDGVPEGTPKDVIMQKAIEAGLATQEDFAPRNEQAGGFVQPFNQASGELPKQQAPADQGMLENLRDFFFVERDPTKKRSVFNSPELNELSLAALKAGAGGLLTGDPAEIGNIIKKQFPEAELGKSEETGEPMVRLPSGDYFLQPKGVDAGDVGRFVTDVAMFLPAARVTGTSAQALGRGAMAAGATSLAGQGAEAALGGQVDPVDVGIDIAAQGAGQLLEPVVSAGIKKLRGALKGLTTRQREAAAALRDPEEGLAQVATTAARSPTQTLPEVMADPEVMKAAQELGINVNPSVYSTSDIYREMENAVKSIPASQLSVQEKESVRQLSERADELVNQWTGTTDMSSLSSDFSDRMLSTVKELEDEARVLYDQVSEAVPPSLKVDASATRDALDDLAEQFGSIDDLPPQLRRVYEAVTREGGTNYALLDQIRKDIGEGAFKNAGPFKDASANLLKQVYGTLTDDTGKAVELLAPELVEVLNQGKQLVSQRKQLEDAMQGVLGRNLSKSLMTEIGTALGQAKRGSGAKLREIFNTVPEDMRQQVALGALSDVLGGSRRANTGFSLSGFVTAYDALKRNATASAPLFQNITPEAATRIEQMYKVSKGLLDANRRDLNNPSGTARAVLGGLDAPQGALAKLYGVAKSTAAGAAATTPLDAGAIGGSIGFMNAIKAERTPMSQRADALLSSDNFRRAVQAYIDGNEQAAEQILTRGRAYERWLETVPAEDKRSIVRQGAIQWLLNDEGEQDAANPAQ